MPARLRRPRRPILMMALAVVWLTSLGIHSAIAATGYSRDVCFVGAYEHQVDSRTCTAASVAMMMNMIDRHDLNLPQASILRFEQSRDALSTAARGSDPLGWALAASYYSRYTWRPTVYHWEAYDSRGDALNRAATLIAWTGKPVGLLVLHGKHAVVMTGMTASANPNQTTQFTLGNIAISDPNGFTHRWYVGASYTPLNTYLETDATAAFDAQWVAKYVIVAPQV